MKKLFLAAFTLLTLAGTAFAQNTVKGADSEPGANTPVSDPSVVKPQFTVTGVITDAGTGEPIPFASVVVKGTMIGAASGIDGQYSIKVPENAVLIFSFVGYNTVEMTVGGKSIIDIALEQSEQSLADVVVVAYGTQKKEAVTGSVTSIEGNSLAKVPVSSVDKMLSGKLAGVTVSQVSGQPGSFSDIRIRGTSSINASNSPLWVIDGIPVISGNSSDMTNSGNYMTALNPNDIESITVLKDAASAAAYGSRGANGVILITTKSGKEGKSQFTASAKYGVSWLQSDTGFRPMTGQELLTYDRAAAVNAGFNPDDPEGGYYLPESMASQAMTDWVDVLTRPGSLQEYQISANGGNAKSTYYTSFDYQKTNGVFYGVD